MSFVWKILYNLKRTAFLKLCYFKQSLENLDFTFEKLKILDGFGHFKEIFTFYSLNSVYI